MTSPDLYKPSKYIDVGSAPGQQYVTEQSVANGQNADMQNLMGELKDTFFDNLLGGFLNVPLAIIDGVLTAINNFIRDLVYALKGVTGGFVDLTGFLSATDTKATAASTAASAAQAAAAAASASAAANNLTVQQVRSQLVQLADNIPAVNAWESMVPGQQVSFPVCMLNETIKTLQVSTGSSTVPTSGSGSHSHTQRGSTNPGYSPTLNAVEGVWIQALYSAGRATVSFFIGPGSSSSPSLFVYFGRMTETGDLIIEYVSPDQKPIISNQLQLVNVTAPTDVLYDFGEWMFVGIHQQGSGFPRSLYCNEMTSLPLDPDAFPKQQKMHFTSTTALTAGSTLPKSSQLYTSPFVPWVGFGVRLRTGDPLPRAWYDPLDGNSSFGIPGWTAVAVVGLLGALVIKDGVAGFSGTTNGTQRSLYDERVAYDDIQGEWNVIAPSAQVQSYIYHSNSNGTSYMAIEQTSTSTSICRFISGARTVLSTTPDTTSGAAYRVTVGLDTSGKEVHFVEKKAADTTTWVPAVSYLEPTAGALGTRGAGFRYGGYEARRGGFAVNSGGTEYWAMRDNVVLEEAA